MITRNKLLAGFGALAVAADLLLTAGCSSQLNDQGGVPQASADYELTYLNVSSFPNITLVCIKGIGFATTTREYNAVIRVPEWDAFCATKEKGVARVPSPSPSLGGVSPLSQTSP